MVNTPLKAVYYYDESLKYCPVKKYLGCLSPVDRDSEDVKARKVKLLIDIDNKIQKLLENNCHPIPPIAKSLKGFGVIEIRQRKDEDILIRIIYFRCDNMMVLLHGFEKQDDYDSIKIKREIKKQYKIAEAYKKAFILSKKLYEEYK